MERIRRQRLWGIPVVATRQKHNGMSWPKSGSGALAIITAARINGELENWMAAGVWNSRWPDSHFNRTGRNFFIFLPSHPHNSSETPCLSGFQW